MNSKAKLPLVIGVTVLAVLAAGYFAFSAMTGKDNGTQADITSVANEIKSTRTDTATVPKSMIKGMSPGIHKGG